MGAVPELEQRQHVIRFPPPHSHFYQRPDDVPDHVSKKRGPLDRIDDHVVLTRDAAASNATYRAGRIAACGSERSKVVLPYEKGSRRIHPVGGQRGGDVPGIPSPEGRWDAAVPDTVDVLPSPGRTARIKVVRHCVDRPHGYIAGRQRIEGAQHGRRVDDTSGVETGYLSGRVDPRIGTARRRDSCGMTEQPPQGIFERRLNSPLTGLNLPTTKVRAIVLEN
jgi:hypothetical protein